MSTHRATPDGERGVIELLGEARPGVDCEDGWRWVETTIGGEDWRATVLDWRPVLDGEHSAWCDRGQLEDMCPDCVRTARDSFDRDEVAS